jgi:hypothetical protein
MDGFIPAHAVSTRSHSWVPAELVAVADASTRAAPAGSGWTIFVEAQRHLLAHPVSSLPDAASALDERKAESSRRKGSLRTSHFPS